MPHPAAHPSSPSLQPALANRSIYGPLQADLDRSGQGPWPAVRRHSLGLLLAALLSAGGCVSSQQTTPTAPPQPAAPPPVVEPPPPPPTPARIGLLVPLSGRAGELGRDLLDAAQMAIFDVGDSDVVLLPRDTGETPEAAATAARASLGDGAELILGPLFASSTRAVGPVAAEAGVKVLSFSNDAATAGGNVFVLGFRPEEQVDRVARYAHGRGLLRLGLLAPDDAYGTLAARAFETTLASLGVIGTATFYRTEGDPSGSIGSLFSSSGIGQGFDGVLVADGGNRLTRVATTLQSGQHGPPVRRLLGTSRWEDEAASLRDAALTGGWIAAVPPAAEDAFSNRFEAVFGRTPRPLAALAYDVTALAVLLARSDRTYAPTTLLDPQGFVGSLGAFRLRADGTAEHRLAILEVDPAGLTVVDPQPQGFFDGVAATN